MIEKPIRNLFTQLKNEFGFRDEFMAVENKFYNIRLGILAYYIGSKQADIYFIFKFGEFECVYDFRCYEETFKANKNRLFQEALEYCLRWESNINFSYENPLLLEGLSICKSKLIEMAKSATRDDKYYVFKFMDELPKEWFISKGFFSGWNAELRISKNNTHCKGVNSDYDIPFVDDEEFYIILIKTLLIRKYG